MARVVGKLTIVSDNPDQSYRITILNSPNVNAFALPGGYLYVTRGLLALANDSAELAAVLAHEMGHVTANHGILRQQKEAEVQLASRVVTDVLDPGSPARAEIIRGKLRLAQFSRNQELEADAIGIKATSEAGYDSFAGPALPAVDGGLCRVPQRERRAGCQPRLPGDPSERAAAHRARDAARPPVPAAGQGERDRDAYLAGIDGMLFGDTPDEGFVRGRSFMHPKLGIAFTVPEGFVIDNSAAAVTAAGPGDTAIRFRRGGRRAERRDGRLHQERLGVGLDVSSVTATRINGSEAATARASADGWRFSITVVRAGDQVYRLLRRHRSPTPRSTKRRVRSRRASGS